MEKEQAIQALRDIGLAQQNASMLLKGLRMKCKPLCLENDFLMVMGAFAEAERVAAQELRKLLLLQAPLPTPEQAVLQCHAEVQSGEKTEREAREQLQEVHRAWTPSQPDRRMRAAGDHSFDEERTADVADERR
jgi:hypothetical protein